MRLPPRLSVSHAAAEESSHGHQHHTRISLGRRMIFVVYQTDLTRLWSDDCRWIHKSFFAASTNF